MQGVLGLELLTLGYHARNSKTGAFLVFQQVDIAALTLTWTFFFVLQFHAR